MPWFSSWFKRSTPKSRIRAPRPALRPQLEVLEDRVAMNASSIFDAGGQLVRVVVNNQNVMIRYDQTGAHHLANKVLRAHVYRDPQGNIGISVVYTTFKAFDFYTGTFLGDNIIDYAKAYDRSGNVLIDVTHTTGSDFFTSETTAAGTRLIPNPPGIIALLIHPYQDSNGNFAKEISRFDTVTTCKLYQSDSTGVHFLAKDAVADKAYTGGPGWSRFGSGGARFVLDVTHINDRAFEFTNTYSILLGTNISI